RHRRRPRHRPRRNSARLPYRGCPQSGVRRGAARPARSDRWPACHGRARTTDRGAWLEGRRGLAGRYRRDRLRRRHRADATRDARAEDLPLMIMGIAALVFIPLLAVSIAHFLWGVGLSWPIRDPDLLVRTVIGRPGVTRVPRLASIAVAAATLGAGIVALSLADESAGGWWLNAAGTALAALLVGRGVAGYLP